MGEINCKDCVMKDLKSINDLCLDSNQQKLEEDIYMDTTNNKAKHNPNDKSKTEDKNSPFNGQKNSLGVEDKEVITKIGYDFEKVNDKSPDGFDSKNVFNKNVIVNSSQEKNTNFLNNGSQEGRYMDPYGLNYQEYNLSSLENPQDIYENNQNYVSYISYKECKAPQDRNNLYTSEENRESNKKK